MPVLRARVYAQHWQREERAHAPKGGVHLSAPMPRLVAFLRAINAGRGRAVKMGLLRRVFESLGFCEVTTFIASGNVVFDTGARDVKMLEKKIERKLRQALAYDVAVFIRSAIELRQIATFGPSLDHTCPRDQGSTLSSWRTHWARGRSERSWCCGQTRMNFESADARSTGSGVESRVKQFFPASRLRKLSASRLRSAELIPSRSRSRNTCHDDEMMRLNNT